MFIRSRRLIQAPLGRVARAATRAHSGSGVPRTRHQAHRMLREIVFILGLGALINAGGYSFSFACADPADEVTLFIPDSYLAAGLDAPVLIRVAIIDFVIERGQWVFVARV